MIKARPPKGVIIPKNPLFVKQIRYNDPENNNMPVKARKKAYFNIFLLNIS